LLLHLAPRTLPDHPDAVKVADETVSRETLIGLFTDTELAEHNIEYVLHIDPAGNPTQRPRGEAQILRRQLRCGC